MPYAEDLNFWQTGQSAPDVWVDETKRQLVALGGEFKGEGFGQDAGGRAAYMLAFEIEGDKFKIIFAVESPRPVLAGKCSCCGLVACGECGPYTDASKTQIDDPCKLCGKCMSHCPHW
jgi:hypothetical protein